MVETLNQTYLALVSSRLQPEANAEGWRREETRAGLSFYMAKAIFK
jgi:hypothetical protein